ncbi:polyphenol oxidoreductase [Lewinellaceae bacterium SD302]|nr:polyphenol oxidoreductase [Lewinellaceae bacterium SD302]
MYHPKIFTPYRELIVAQSFRSRGVSPYPAEALNLGLYTDDQSENILVNRRRFAETLGISPAQFAGSHQVHGSDVIVVNEPGELKGYDALITQRPEIILTITTADCFPILIYDPANRSCGAAHAGWRGTAAGIAHKTLVAMQENFGSKPADCLVYVGPGISYNHFEVGREVAIQFPKHHVKAGEKPGKYFVDLSAYNHEQLTNAGVPTKQIEVSPDCTVVNNDRYFSYRRESGETGRMLAVIGLKNNLH